MTFLHARFIKAFSLIEVTISLVIVGVLFVAALSTLAASKRHERKVLDIRRGQLLAQGLMSEILRQPYWDPATGGGMGPRATEAATDDRSLFDDVDDFNGWQSSVPKRRNGNAIPSATGWERFVKIAWLDPDDLDLVTGVETGIKRIIVTVKHYGITIAELWAIRTNVRELS